LTWQATGTFRSVHFQGNAFMPHPAALFAYNRKSHYDTCFQAI
jgi:hypothetical protein